MAELVLGEPEAYSKARKIGGDNKIYATPYGALHVEPNYGRLLKTLTPPSEPDQNTDWEVPSNFDPRIIYSDVIPERNKKISDMFSRVTVVYNLDDGEGDVPTEICVPNTEPRRVYGVKEIRCTHGRINIYGGFTPLNEE